MNKKLVIVCIIITAVAALGLIFVMVLGLNGYSAFNFSPTFVGVRMGSGNTVLLKEEQFSMAELQKLSLAASSQAVSVRTISGNTATIRQYGSENADQEELFVLDVSGGEARIRFNNRRFFINFFSFEFPRLEIDMPADWVGDVDLNASSGSLTLESSVQWTNVLLSTNSGSVKAQGSITAKNLDIRCTSGAIKLMDDVAVENRFYSHSSSGKFTAERNITANQVDISVSSGMVEMHNTAIETTDLKLSANSGGLSCGQINTDTYDVGTTSGAIRIDSLSGRGNLKCNSGSLKVTTLMPTGDSSLRTTSGGITVGLPSDSDVTVNARTSSGGISSDYNLNFSGSERHNATLTLGSGTHKVDINVNSGGVKINQA